MPLNASPRFGFEFLLLTIVALLIVPPLFPLFERGFVVTLLLTILLLASLYLVVNRQRDFLVCCVIFFPSLVTRWWPGLLGENLSWLVSDALYIASCLYVCYFILRFLFQTNRITLDMVYASMCLYMLIGVVWVFIYHLIELASPGSFNINNLDDAASVHRSLLPSFTYYSYVTLSTLGYGDITPVTRIARSWSALEAIVGQFYLAVVLARMVGLYISSRDKEAV